MRQGRTGVWAKIKDQALEEVPGNAPRALPGTHFISKRCVRSVVGELELIEIDGIIRLLVVPVQLEVHDNTPPTRCGEGRICLVKRVRHTVQGDRLVKKFIAGSALHLNDDVVPGVTQRFARRTGRDPFPVKRIPYSPYRSIHDLALGAKHETLIVHELSDIELDVLRQTQVGSVEVGIVGKVVQ